MNCSLQQPNVSALNVLYLESRSVINRGVGKAAGNGEKEAGVWFLPPPLDSDVNPLILEHTSCGSHYLTMTDFLARPASKPKPRAHFVVTTFKAESPLVEPVI